MVAVGRADHAIRARLAKAGRMTFAEFMQRALYGPGGYYAEPRVRIGPQGDFYTAPALHPAFGTLLAGQLREIWHDLGRPAPFQVLEIGAGRGTMAADILHAWAQSDASLFAATHYTISDLTDPRSGRDAVPILERATFRPAAAGFPPDFEGVAIANEVLDALPVHRVQKLQGKLQELYVVADSDRLGEAPGPLSDELQNLQIESWEPRMPDGGRAEAGTAALVWIGELAARMRRGVALLIDYGADRDALLARPAGTLRTYRRHRLLDTPFEAIGECDITCHVDFSSMREAADRLNMTIMGEIDQATFLQNLGIGAIREALAAAALDPAASDANLAALHDLVSPQGFGSFRVLGLARGCEPRLSGLTGKRPVGPLCAPAATGRHMALWGGLPLESPWQEAVADPETGALFVGRVEDLD